MKSRGAAENYSNKQDQTDVEAMADVHRAFLAARAHLRCILWRVEGNVKRLRQLPEPLFQANLFEPMD
jgi:hypothetical protein